MTQQPWQVKEAGSLIDAFTRDLAQFVSGMAGVASGVQEKPVRPRLVARYFVHMSGVVVTFQVTEDCYYLGCAELYNSGTVTVTTNGDDQTALVTGSSRELTQLIAASGVLGDTLGKIRTFVTSGTKFTVGTNTGPQLIAHLFELLD